MSSSAKQARATRWAVMLCALFGTLTAGAAGAAEPLKVLFLGDRGHHRPVQLFRQLDPVLRPRGVELTYTEDVAELNPATLAKYQALLVYANIDRISPEQAKALLDYVAGGGGFVPVHCASYCFRNSPEVVALIGAQFLRHGMGTVRDTIAEPEHPVMKGYAGFESVDETYVHHKHDTKGRTVLAYRVDGNTREPWTWVKEHGKGRVFYTAWGHDGQTWKKPGFQNLIERGIRWAAHSDPALAGTVATGSASARAHPEMTPKRTDVKPFDYQDAKIAFYPPGGRSRGDGTWNKMQLPVSVEESRKHMVVPRGFEVQLFAAEPEIGKPLCMNWDERGRLWIVETVDYPNELQPEGKGHDRIKVCEDTDGDGKADRFTIFAEKLSIPTSLAFYRGGVIVHQAPQTLFLKDNDGDGKADERRVLFEGWGTRDTHSGPSNLRYGLDNWFWGIVGYSGFAGRVGGEDLRFVQGFFRFRPDGSKLEYLRSTSNNSWGVGISEEGIVFGSTANRVPSVYLPIPNRYYEAVRGWSSSVLELIADTHLFKPITDRVRQVDQHGGYTAGAGHALYTARAYPEFYWNRTAFVAEPTGHLVGTFILERDGSDFHSQNPVNLLASDDEWTAPTMAEVGPDGQVWVIDWYNYIVQHNPTPAGFRTGKGNAYETELRDKTHGRIYRVVNRSAPAPKRTSLAGATPTQLVEALNDDNMFWRLHAQRLLVERGRRDVLPLLFELVRNRGMDAIGLNPAAIHALWTIHGLGGLDGSDPRAQAVAIEALGHPSAGVRMNAVKVLPRGRAAVDAILAKAIVDPDAQVRLAAMLALADQPATPGVGQAVASALARPENANDRWIPEAATAAAARNDAEFLAAVARMKPLAARAGSSVGIVAEHYARGVPADSAGSLVAGLENADPAVAEPIIAGLVKGWPRDRPVTLDAKTEEAIGRLLARVSPGARGQLLRLAESWGSKHFESYAAEVARSLAAEARDESLGDERRVASARQLVEFRPADATVADMLLDALTPRTPPSVATGLIDALGESTADGVAPALLRRMGQLTPTAKTAALRVMLRRPASTRALLDAIGKDGTLSLSDLTLDQQQALAAHPNPRIRARARELLARGGTLPNPDRQKVIDELSPIVLRKGDAVKGHELFRLQCAKCHTHGSEGGQIGPDLTGMAVHPKEELLVHIIDPSRSVEGNFRQYTVATSDGQVFVGVLTSETKTSIELADAEGKTHVILRNDIDELQASSKSIMPDGFEKQFTPEAIGNLLEFLTQRGKYLPLDLGKVATIVSTRGMFYSKDAQLERLVFADWSPKTFEGVPFRLVDPKGDRVPNVVLLYGPQGSIPPTMPRSVTLPCNTPARAIHLLSGVSGWGYPNGQEGSVSMIVRLHYADGTTEDHRLENGVHFADYIRAVDVPGSKRAFSLRGQQIRYLAVSPKRSEPIKQIELVKGTDRTAPIVMAVTVEVAEPQ